MNTNKEGLNISLCITNRNHTCQDNRQTQIHMLSQKEKNTKILNLTNHKLIEQTFLLAYIRQLKNG